MKFIVHASGSTGNCYQVTSGAQSLVIDPGISIRKIKIALKFKLSAVSGALISHSHGDHSKAVHHLAKSGIDCLMTEATASALKFKSHRLKVIEPLKQYEIGKFSVVGFPTQHDCPGSVGFLISDGVDKLMFATDTYYLYNQFAGVNYIAIECNYSPETMAPGLDPVVKKRLYKSHFSLENVIKFLISTDLSQVREVHLIHMSKGNSDPDWFKSKVQRATGKPVYTHI